MAGACSSDFLELEIGGLPSGGDITSFFIQRS